MEDEERHDIAGRARLDPFEITARARGSDGEDGSLALPRTAHWPIFPFVTEGLRVRPLEDPVLSEPPRRDVTAEECGTCHRTDQDFVWTDERWLVSMSPEPESLPGAVLHPRTHLDFPDLTADRLVVDECDGHSSARSGSPNPDAAASQSASVRAASTRRRRASTPPGTSRRDAVPTCVRKPDPQKLDDDPASPRLLTGPGIGYRSSSAETMIHGTYPETPTSPASRATRSFIR